jgi:hypothetical protein
VRQFIISIASAVALYALMPSALAFTSQPVNPQTLTNKLADPEDIAEQMSNGQSVLEQRGAVPPFSAPSSSTGSNSWFGGNPSTVFVPNEHR